MSLDTNLMPQTDSFLRFKAKYPFINFIFESKSLLLKYNIPGPYKIMITEQSYNELLDEIAGAGMSLYDLTAGGSHKLQINGVTIEVSK